MRSRFSRSSRCADVERRQDLLPRLGRNRSEARSDEVGQPPRLCDVHRQRLQVVRHQRRQRNDLLKVGLDVPLQRVDLEAVVVAEQFEGLLDTGAEIRADVDHLGEADARQPLHDDAQAAVGQLEHLVDVAGGPHRVEVFLQRFVFAGLALGEDGDQAAARHRFVDEADRALARDRERHERVREQHRVAQRQHGQLARQPKRRAIAGRGIGAPRVQWDPSLCPIRCSLIPQQDFEAA